MSRAPDEIRAYVRFQLDQLSQKNAQHEFERLCFDLAQARIAPNLLPATGPVQAGGDQGRDFESYRTYLATSPLSACLSVALQPTDLLVAGCTLDKRFLSKLRADLRTIFGFGTRPSHVVYFCNYDVAVSKRHAAQDECRSKYSAHLEIFDAAAIANMLAAPDVFWIAERYLSVPSDFLPPAPSDESEYGHNAARWLKASSPPPHSYANFLEIKRGLRKATFEDQARPDLRAWLRKMEEFAVPEAGTRLRRKAKYEIAVANLRGLGDMDPAHGLLAEYFGEISPELQPCELEDAAILMTYCFAASRLGQFRVDDETLQRWQNVTGAAVSDALLVATNPGDKCTLLSAKTFVDLNNDDLSPEQRIKNSMATWSQIISICRDSPLYPVQRLADLLDTLVPQFSKYPEFLSLTRQVDDLVSSRIGNHVAASRCKARASHMLEAGEYLAAIADLQTARVKWFSGDTMEESIMAMLALSEAYSRLGLEYAARQYAAGALHVCLDYEKEQVKRLSTLAASFYAVTFYWAGEGLTFLHVLQLVMLLHGAIDPDPGNMDRHDNMQDLWEQASTCVALFKVSDMAVFSEAARAISEWPILEASREQFFRGVEEMLPAMRRLNKSIQRESKTVIFSPFLDLGTERRVAWGAIGLEWEVMWSPSKGLTPQAEAICALLQITQVEFARHDLHIVPGKAKIVIRTSSVKEPKVTQEGDNEHLGWAIDVPRNWGGAGESYSRYVTSLVMAIITQCSVLPLDELKKLTELMFEDGLLYRMFVVNSPASLFAYLLPPSVEVDDLAALKPPPHFAAVTPETHDQLAWNGTISDRYDPDKAIEMIRNRYELIPKCMQITWPKLVKNQASAKTLRSLRDNGFPDWFILLLVANIVVNWQLGPFTYSSASTPRRMAEMMGERMRRPEMASDKVFPPSELSGETVTTQAGVLMMTLLSSWGLTCHQRAPDFRGLEEVLRHKLRAFEDDAPHTDIFEVAA